MFDLNQMPKITILNLNQRDIDYILHNRHCPFLRLNRMGEILLVREHRAGLIGIFKVQRNAREQEIMQIILFNEPFNENIKGNISTKVRNLKKIPFLIKPYINMSKSGRSYYIALDYIKEIMREKRDECNFEGFQCPTNIDEDAVKFFLQKIIEYNPD